MDSSDHCQSTNQTLRSTIIVLITLFLGNCTVPPIQQILIIGLTGANSPLSLRNYLEPESIAINRNPEYLVLTQGEQYFHLLEYANDETIIKQLKSNKKRPLAVILAVDALNGIHEPHIQELQLAQNNKIPLLAVVSLRFGELHNSPFKQLVIQEIKQVLADTGFSGTPVQELQPGQAAANRTLLLSILQ